MKNDIYTKRDIEALVNCFYRKVNADELLAPLFERVNWALHLPMMYQFWENTIFFTGSYLGNPMATHILLHKKTPLNHQHFTRWLQLFNTTVDELFEGPKALLAKQRANSIAVVMQTKILQPGE
ncbi:MAG TPA: group III truncated hemoglobin [Chitinophagaceae bacterium]|nr:group III truncated hemoglobin [Chitinophagaceae bacterium]